jgi:hypothetical protein
MQIRWVAKRVRLKGTSARYAFSWEYPRPRNTANETMPHGASGPRSAMEWGIAETSRQSAVNTAANRYKRPSGRRGRSVRVPDREKVLPARKTRLRLAFSTPSAYLLRRDLKTVRPPARSENPTIARPGSTSGATGSRSYLLGGSYFGSDHLSLSGLAFAAALVPSTRTSMRDAYLANCFMFFGVLSVARAKRQHCPDWRHPHRSSRPVGPSRMLWLSCDGCLGSGLKLRYEAMTTGLVAKALNRVALIQSEPLRVRWTPWGRGVPYCTR